LYGRRGGGNADADVGAGAVAVMSDEWIWIWIAHFCMRHSHRIFFRVVLLPFFPPSPPAPLWLFFGFIIIGIGIPNERMPTLLLTFYLPLPFRKRRSDFFFGSLEGRGQASPLTTIQTRYISQVLAKT